MKQTYAWVGLKWVKAHYIRGSPLQLRSAAVGARQPEFRGIDTVVLAALLSMASHLQGWAGRARPLRVRDWSFILPSAAGDFSTGWALFPSRDAVDEARVPSRVAAVGLAVVASASPAESLVPYADTAIEAWL
nr:unnamed protein product [Digitaria exilis]